MGNPTWMYRRIEGGGIGAKLFLDSDDIPKDGWYESPAFVPEAEPPPEPPPEPPKPAPKRTAKPRTTRRKPK